MPRRWTTIIAILAVEAFVLVLRAIGELRLLGHGYGADVARDLSYLAVPPLLLVLLAPAFYQHRALLARLFDPRRITAGVVISGLAVGALARLAWWCSVILRGAVATRGPADLAMAWDCPMTATLLLAVLVWICLVPLVEETLGRGLLQSLLEYRGRRFAIVVSAVIFAVYHVPGAMVSALLMGIVFACLRANSGSLWPGIAAHAAFDGLVIADWRCLHGHWLPGTGGGALPVVLVTALMVFLLCAASIVLLIVQVRPGPPDAARATPTSQGVGHPLDDV